MREMEARLQDEIADLERRLEDRRTRLRDVQKAMRDTEGRRGERGEETERPGRRVPPPANIGPEIEERFRKLLLRYYGKKAGGWWTRKGR
jgi:hypothetical protein